MADTYCLLLSLIVFLPCLGALVLAFVPRKNLDLLRWITFAVTAAVFALSVFAFMASNSPAHFKSVGDAARYMQDVFNYSWIPSFHIEYFMGVDGISFPLVMLTTFISMLAMAASWSITRHVKAYCILFLLLETGMLGVFFALDFFLFYVFWEVMLLPMYFLIGVWGGPRREYAAIKFFLYTLVGSVLMLVAILLLYFNSDMRVLAAISDLELSEATRSRLVAQLAEEGLTVETPVTGPIEWARLHVHPRVNEMLGAGAEENAAFDQPIHSFNLLALAAMGQHTSLFSDQVLGQSLQWWAFLLLFIGFAVKVPSVPVHTWLPDAHVEAPTPISMILAGILLKMGGYGIIRICYPICPAGGFELAWLVCGLGVVSMVYGAFAALAQSDFKRLVAYSSVSHMGYVVLGLGVWSAQDYTNFNAYYWNQGVQGAMYQMIAHGISSAGMFFMVGVIYDRVHHRNLNEFGGLFGKMPVYTALSIGIFFAGLGLPGLCGFIGEVLVVLSAWNYSKVIAIISASVVILTASYILWTLQRVYLGAEYKGPHEEELRPSNARENLIAGTLFVLAIIFGVFPYQIPFTRQPSILAYMEPTVTRQVTELAEWTKYVATPAVAQQAVAAEEADDPPPAADQQAAAEPGAEEQAAARAAEATVAVR